jgi:hypothetical protein
VVDEKKSEKSAVDENVPTIDGEKSEWCAAGENVPAVDEKVRLNFGSLHGSVFTSDNGHCYLSLRVFRSVCKYDLQLFRPRSWYLGMSWCGFLVQRNGKSRNGKFERVRIIKLFDWVVFFKIILTPLTFSLSLSSPPTLYAEGSDWLNGWNETDLQLHHFQYSLRYTKCVSVRPY